MQDQVLTLVLLGQTEMAKAAKGMMVAFIDFTKAYDKVDQVKLWSCLEQLGINDRFLTFLKALYQESSCRVRVSDRLSEEFDVRHWIEAGLCSFTSAIFFVH